MITLSNGHKINYVVASGALGFDGQGWPWEKPLVKLGLIKPELFTTVLKTLTLHPREGNLKMWKPWECVRLIRGGSVNKIGLTNPGINWWCDNIGVWLDYYKFPTVASIFGTLEELVEMTELLNSFDFQAIEVNPSCPNTGHVMDTAASVIRIVRAVQRVSRHPLIVKVSVDQDYLGIAQGLDGFVEAISLNSVPWKTVYPNGEMSPLWKLEKKVAGGGGGVSGGPAQHFNWRAVAQLVRQGLVPVIAPSIMEFNDLARVRKLGAQAVSFGAIHLRTPWKPTSIVEKDMACQTKCENFSVR